MEYLTSYHHDIFIFPVPACPLKIYNHVLGNFSKFVELKRGQGGGEVRRVMFSYWFPLWSPTVNRQCFSDWITLIRTSTRTYQDSPILSICLFVCLFFLWMKRREWQAVMCDLWCVREGGRAEPLTNINFHTRRNINDGPTLHRGRDESHLPPVTLRTSWSPQVHHHYPPDLVN